MANMVTVPGVMGQMSEATAKAAGYTNYTVVATNPTPAPTNVGVGGGMTWTEPTLEKIAQIKAAQAADYNMPLVVPGLENVGAIGAGDSPASVAAIQAKPQGQVVQPSKVFEEAAQLPSVFGKIIKPIQVAFENQVIEQAGKAYDEQVAALPANTTVTETKQEFTDRSIKEATVTITTPEIANRVKLEEDFLSKGEASIGWNNTADAVKAAGLELPKGKDSRFGEKALTKDDMAAWYNTLSANDKDAVLLNFAPYSAVANLKKVGTQLASMVPIYGTIKYWDEMNGWQKALSIGTDILVVAPIASGGLKLAGVKPIGDYIPRIGLLQVAEARIGEMTVRISKPVILSSANDVAKFEKIKEAVAKEWAWLQNSKMTPKEGEALMPDAVLKQLEGLPYSEKTIIEYPYKFIVSHGQFSTPWGQAIKRPGAITLYSSPIDEALTEIPGIGKVGYGTSGKMSKEAFEAEVKRVKVANLLEERPWEMSPEVRAAMKKARETKVATATEEATGVKEKFKTITEKKTVTEPSTKASSETERLETIRRKPKPYTGTTPGIVWAVSALIASTATVSSGKPMTTTSPEVVKAAEQVQPEINTIIKHAMTGDTAVDAITQHAIDTSLQKIANTNTEGMTDNQIHNLIEQQVDTTIKTDLTTQQDTKIAQELKTHQATITKTATTTAAEIVRTVRTKTKPKIIPGGNELQIERVEGVPDNPGIITYEDGIVKVILSPPYREGTEDIGFDRLKVVRRGKGSQESTLRVSGGQAPRLIQLSRGIAKTSIRNGRRMTHTRQGYSGRGPGIMDRSGRVHKQRRGSVI